MDNNICDNTYHDIEHNIEYEIPFGGACRNINLKASSGWASFKIRISDEMDSSPNNLHLAYKISTETARQAVHLLDNYAAYDRMVEDTLAAMDTEELKAMKGKGKKGAKHVFVRLSDLRVKEVKEPKKVSDHCTHVSHTYQRCVTGRL